MKIAVLGAGTWGSALTILLNNNGHELTLWTAVEKEYEELSATRKVKNLKGIKLADNIKITNDIKEACKDKDLIVFAVASPYVRMTARKAAPYIDRKIPVVNVAKGIEEDTLMTLTEIIESEFEAENGDKGIVTVLSGPSHAEEVSVGMPTTAVVGAKSREIACMIQDAFMSDRFRVYTSPDIIGIEFGGSLKNVIALAAGVIDGLGLGDNAKAALITRGISEIGRLGMKLGGRLETFAGLSGIGDLIVTCCSSHSRNHNAGYLMGQGKTMDEAMAEVGQVVEGVYSAKAASKLAKANNIDMPIVEQMNKVLFENKKAEDALNELLLRDKKDEHSGFDWDE